MSNNPEFLMYCFANSIDPNYKFIEKYENGTIKLFKNRDDKYGEFLDSTHLHPMIFRKIPTGRRCSLRQVLSGYKIGTSDRSFKFPGGIHYTYPYNLISDIFSDKLDYDEISLVMELPMTEDRWTGLNYALKTLTEREQIAIKYYYQEEDITLGEGGKILNISKERFRQIIRKAIRKLRHPTRAIYILKGYEIGSGVLRKQIYDLRVDEIRKINSAIDKKIEKLKTKSNDSTIDDISIDELNLSVRSYNCLCRAQVKTLGDLSKMTICDLMKVRNLGQKSINEIQNKLKELGIELEVGEAF